MKIALPSAPVVQGQALKFQFTYTNTGGATESIDILKVVYGANGKVVASTKVRRTIKAGATLKVNSTEAAVTKLKPGVYSETITITDHKTKTVVATGTFTFTVKAAGKAKPPVKKVKPPIKKKPPVKKKKVVKKKK